MRERHRSPLVAKVVEISSPGAGIRWTWRSSWHERGKLVGVSGGVDSSVAALLLQREGVEVAGLVRNWNDDGSGDCRAEDDRRDAVTRSAAGWRPDPFPRFLPGNNRDVFRTSTPNTNCRCARRSFQFPRRRAGGLLGMGTNRHRALRHFAGREGNDVPPAAAPSTAAGPELTLRPPGWNNWPRRGPAANCTNSGFARSPPRLVCRRSAKKPPASCFIGRTRFPRIPLSRLPAHESGGEIRVDGVRVEEQPDVFFYTLGQSRAAIGGMRGRPQAPWFVVGKDVANNILYVDRWARRPWLQSRTLWSEPVHWIVAPPAPPVFPRLRRRATANRTRNARSAYARMAAHGSAFRVRSARSRPAVAGALRRRRLPGGGVIERTDAPAPPPGPLRERVRGPAAGARRHDQALAQVRRLADTGQADGAHLQPLIESVFRIDAESPPAVYGDAGRRRPRPAHPARVIFSNQARDPMLPRLALAFAAGGTVFVADGGSGARRARRHRSSGAGGIAGPRSASTAKSPGSPGSTSIGSARCGRGSWSGATRTTSPSRTGRRSARRPARGPALGGAVAPKYRRHAVGFPAAQAGDPSGSTRCFIAD